MAVAGGDILVAVLAGGDILSGSFSRGRGCIRAEFVAAKTSGVWSICCLLHAVLAGNVRRHEPTCLRVILPDVHCYS